MIYNKKGTHNESQDITFRIYTAAKHQTKELFIFLGIIIILNLCFRNMNFKNYILFS